MVNPALGWTQPSERVLAAAGVGSPAPAHVLPPEDYLTLAPSGQTVIFAQELAALPVVDDPKECNNAPVLTHLIVNLTDQGLMVFAGGTADIVWGNGDTSTAERSGGPSGAVTWSGSSRQESEADEAAHQRKGQDRR